MSKSWEEINRKIRDKTAVVLTAAEFKELAKTASPDELCEKVDVVTAATYSPMCSSSVIINFGHANPPIRMEKISLNGVPAYEGLAAVDTMLGATAVRPDDSSYGGAHVIEELVRGKSVLLEASAKGTDCYPRREIKALVGKESLNEFYFFNPRNAYQNYGAAVNGSARALKTYMGVLKPGYGNVNYATTGEWSPLLNDPRLRTIGIGTSVFLGGAQGHVAFQGTQFNTKARVNAQGIPVSGARTLALIADAKQASPEFVAAGTIAGYGISLFIGVGFAIPVLDADMAKALSIRNSGITQLVRDYSSPEKPVVAETTYAELSSGTLRINDMFVPTACLSSKSKALAIMERLREAVLSGAFRLVPPVEALPEDSLVRGLVVNGGPAAIDGLAANEGIDSLSEFSDNVLEIRENRERIYVRERCVDCGACVVHCPVGALRLEGFPGTLRYDAHACTSCGACFEACMRGALHG